MRLLDTDTCITILRGNEAVIERARGRMPEASLSSRIRAATSPRRPVGWAGRAPSSDASYPLAALRVSRTGRFGRRGSVGVRSRSSVVVRPSIPSSASASRMVQTARSGEW